MKTLPIVCCLLTFFSARCQIDIGRPRLERAYINHSPDELNQFFIDWSHDSLGIARTQLSPSSDTIHEAYKLANTLYLQYSFVGDSTKWNLINPYTVSIYFTDKILFTKSDSEVYATNYINQHVTPLSMRQTYLRKEKGHLPQKIMDIFAPRTDGVLIDSILDFRPSVIPSGIPVVFANATYEKEIRDFLKLEDFIPDRGVIVNVDDEMRNRRVFFETKASRISGGNSPYWADCTNYISPITFDRQMKYAKVIYSNGDGEAIFKNVNGDWIFMFLSNHWFR